MSPVEAGDHGSGGGDEHMTVPYGRQRSIEPVATQVDDQQRHHKIVISSRPNVVEHKDRMDLHWYRA